MAVVKANYVRRGVGERETAKANIRYIQERPGKDREKFTGIWMVVVEDRIFGRSYTLSERSWYTALASGEAGDIKCGKEIIPIKGAKPKDIKSITGAINKAYEKKYLVKASNKKWVDGLAEPERVARTMEFIPL